MTLNSKKFSAAVAAQAELWSNVQDFLGEVKGLEGLEASQKEAADRLARLKTEIETANSELSEVEGRIDAAIYAMDERLAASKRDVEAAKDAAKSVLDEAKLAAARMIASAESDVAAIALTAEKEEARAAAARAEREAEEVKLAEIRAAIAKIARG